MVFRAQLNELGYQRWRRETLVARGLLCPHLGSWFVPGTVTTLSERDAHALSARFPEGSIITGAAAAGLQGWGGKWPHEFGVTTPMAYPPKGKRPRILGARLVRANWDGTVVERGGLLLADRVTALMDCLELVLPETSDALLDHFLQKRWLTADLLENRLARRMASRRGRRPSLRLRTAVDLAAEGTQSHAERLLANALREAGLRRGRARGWHANHRVQVPDALNSQRPLRSYRIDFAWPDCRLAVEVDGRRFHSSEESFEGDRERRFHLQAAGWTVVEFTWAKLARDPGAAAVAEAIKTQLAALRRTIQTDARARRSRKGGGVKVGAGRARRTGASGTRCKPPRQSTARVHSEKRLDGGQSEGFSLGLSPNEANRLIE